MDNGQLTGHYYAYNAVSLFQTASAYLRVTGDASLLAAIDGAGSTRWFTQLADMWRGATTAAFPLFGDFSGDKDAYLECVPTYRHATAGLQASAAAMALDLADLRAWQGDAAEAGARRGVAAAVAAATVAQLYVARTAVGAPPPPPGAPPGDAGGWWAVLDTRTGAKTEVRHVVDTVYAAAGLCGGAVRGAAWGCALAPAQRAQMAAFARAQLVLGSGAWIRALSPRDAAAPITRPDHGDNGAYDAWPALLFEAMTTLDGGFNASVPYLRGVAAAARRGPFGQAHQIDAATGAVYKPVNGWTRAVANNGGAFAEGIVRTLFGFSPPWGGDWRRTLAPAFAGVPRGNGLEGARLTGIRAPGGEGYVDATLTAGGVEFAFRAG